MYKDIFRVILSLLITPRAMWQRIQENGESVQTFQSRFLFPVFGLIAIAQFAGGLWIHENGSRDVALRTTLVSISAVFGGFYAVVYLLQLIAKKWEVKEYEIQRFVGYSSVVMYLLFLIQPFVANFVLIWLLGLYTFYIVRQGCAVFLNVPTKDSLRFSFVSSLLIISIPLFLYYSLRFALFY